MIRNKFIKIALSTLLVFLALWVATPKVYIHHLLHHDHTALQISNETKLQSQSTEDCDFNEYNKPVYFNIFKFISNLVPLKPQNALNNIQKTLSLSQMIYSAFYLRGPPEAE